MIDPAKINSSLREAFDGFARHCDTNLVRLKLDNIISLFPSLSPHERKVVKGIIVSDFASTLEQDEPEATAGRYPMSRNEKISLYLESSTAHPELMASLGSSLHSLSLRHKFSQAAGIPGLDALQKYPQIEADTRKYVAFYVNRFAHELPTLANQLKDTPYASMIDRALAAKYRDDLPKQTIEKRLSDWTVLKPITPAWNAFDSVASLQPYFAAYAPNVKTLDIFPPVRGCVLKHNKDSHVMMIDYSNLKAQDLGWLNLAPVDIIHPVYILLDHALGVVEGKRQGGFTNDAAWQTQQKQRLQPILKDLVEDYGKAIKAKGYPLPNTPQPIIPAQP